MKNFTKVITSLSLVAAFAFQASASHEFVAADTEAGTKICVAAVSGSKLKTIKAIKTAHVDKKYVVEKVTCNGQNIIDFITENGKNPDKIYGLLTNKSFNEAQHIARL
ncbi:DUF3718 domain-containing protein [Agaribacter flavus]|uniref:DUF3718 domain-containing protein n=1 Tax=Agaribacter flavus TaxID=1902781 RepID=A0ABV7FNS1_9ALTE